MKSIENQRQENTSLARLIEKFPCVHRMQDILRTGETKFRTRALNRPKAERETSGRVWLSRQKAARGFTTFISRLNTFLR